VSAGITQVLAATIEVAQLRMSNRPAICRLHYPGFLSP
jgi:hypothetical protein